MNSEPLATSEQPAERGRTLLHANALYDQTTVAAFLDLSKRTLIQWRADGIGPRFRRIRKRVVYLGRDVNRWVLDKQQLGGTDAAVRATTT